MEQILELKYCACCGLQSKQVKVLVALPKGYICWECSILVVAIIARESVKENKILFINRLLRELSEDIEIVRKWGGLTEETASKEGE